MKLINKYISDLKNISWISYDEYSDAVYYQENSVEINSNKRKSKIYKIELETNINSEVTDGNNDSTPKISPDGKNLAYIKKNQISDNLTLNSLIIKDLSNGNETQITSNNQTISTAYDSTGAFNWNNDSSHIAYTYRNIEERDNDSEPYVVNRIRYRQDVVGWLGDELNKIKKDQKKYKLTELKINDIFKQYSEIRNEIKSAGIDVSQLTKAIKESSESAGGLLHDLPPCFFTPREATEFKSNKKEDFMYKINVFEKVKIYKCQRYL